MVFCKYYFSRVEAVEVVPTDSTSLPIIAIIAVIAIVVAVVGAAVVVDLLQMLPIIIIIIIIIIKGPSLISNRLRRKEGTFCASGLAGIEPTPPAPEAQNMPAFAH
jgi:hypothetical protein